MVSGLTIVAGNVQDSQVIRVIAFIDQLREKRSTSSGVYKHTANNGKWTIFNLDWTAIDLCFIEEPAPTLVIISESGTVVLINNDGYKTIELSTGTNGPGGYGPLRDLCAIDSAAFVVGMGRQIYRISADGLWSNFDNGVTRPSAIGDVCGFNSVHGINENLLYTVGFNGEIWVYEFGKWAQAESPTNVVLHCVRVVNERCVYIGGQKGLLLKGTGGVFISIDTGLDHDIWGMEVFKDKLYFCTEKKLYVVINDKVDEVDIDVEHDTLRSIHSCKDIMYVFGPKNILKSNDCKEWERLSF